MSSGLAGGPAASGALGLATLERQSGGCVSGAQPARASANVKTVTVEVICFFIGFGSTAGKARQWIVSFGSLFVGRRFGGSGHLFHIFENGIELLEVRFRFGRSPASPDLSRSSAIWDTFFTRFSMCFLCSEGTFAGRALPRSRMAKAW